MLDAKGRLAIPVRFREAIAMNAVMTRGADRCLVIFPAERWDTLCRKIDQLPLSDHDTRSYRRFLFASAVQIELDGQGRVLVPGELRDYAGIDRNAVLIGMESTIEIWSEAAWATIATKLDSQADEIITRLASVI